MRLKKLSAFFFAVLLSSLFLAPAPAQAQKVDKVLFSLDWIVYGRHAPYFTAVEKGFYKEQGIDATIQRGYGSADTIKRIAAGKADYGFADMGGLMLARGNDQVKIKAIGVIYSKTPYALFALEGSGINEPKDVVGKSLAAPAGTFYKMFEGVARANNFDPEKVKWVLVEPASLNAMLLSKKTDGMIEYIFTLVLLKKLGEPQGLKPKAWLFADHGFEFYGNSLIASEETLEKNQDVTKRFLKATIKGLDYAFSNPDEAVELLRKSHPEVEAKPAKEELLLVKQLALSEEANKSGIGYMAEDKVKNTIEAMKKYMGLKGDVVPKDVYTNSMLPAK